MSRDETPPGLTQATARKALGQHFLFDPDILKRTALAAGPIEGRTVIEVGPGPGGLTPWRLMSDLPRQYNHGQKPKAVVST